MHFQRARLLFHLSIEQYPRKTVAYLYKFWQTLVLPFCASVSEVVSSLILVHWAQLDLMCGVWYRPNNHSRLLQVSLNLFKYLERGFFHINLHRLISLLSTTSWKALNSFKPVKLLDTLWIVETGISRSLVIPLLSLELLCFLTIAFLLLSDSFLVLTIMKKKLETIRYFLCSKTIIH